MKGWKYLVALLVLLATSLESNKLSKSTGVITQIQDIANSEVLTKQATVQTKQGEVTTQFYQTEIEYKIGDQVVIENHDEVSIIADHYRSPALLNLFAIFVVIVLLVSDSGGLRSLAGLTTSFVIIFRFLLPQIAAGGNPIVAALTASLFILFISYYLTHGFNTKTTIALIGTFISLILVGIMAALFGQSAHLTGFGSEEASFLSVQLGKNFSIYNLLLAGIIIGALGVLDDITISQASVVEELKAANHKLGIKELFERGMKVGHDHIASLVNTLVLVYTGSALPLLLLFVGGDKNWTSLINYEPVAEEIVRTLVGSIGLVAAVPITTLIAAYWYSSNRT